MRITSKIAGVVAATALAATMVAGTATAQSQLKLNQVGAALAFPLIANEIDTRTYITITNVGSEDRNLHFNAISGVIRGIEKGRNEGWQVTDFDCPVTASETVLIKWENDGLLGATLTLECNQADVNEDTEIFRTFVWNTGTLFVTNETHECKDGSCTTNANDLFGDFVVMAGGNAYSAGAVPFQGKDPLADGVSDRDYMFDNSEYAMFPATLATNFLSPGGLATGAQLVLFTLDGRANIGSQASLDIVFYDDDEIPTSAHYTFDCFAIVPLEAININFAYSNLGSYAGHLYMTTIDADQRSNVHDNKFGNGNNIRVVGVHGWLMQQVDGGGFARTLAQGMLPQATDGNDMPTFDGL